MLVTTMTNHQKGTTLVEAMIAALIIGIGLLSIASLQIKAMQASTDAEYRARAVDIAWAMADRMRANLLANTSTGSDYVSTSALSTCPASPSTNCSMNAGSNSVSGVTQCNAAQMAAFDLYEARCAPNRGVKEVLPGGSLTITCNDRITTDSDTCTPGSEMLIRIAWSTREDVLDTNNNEDFITMSVITGLDPVQQ